MLKRIIICLVLIQWSGYVNAGFFPMFSSWEQLGGPGSPFTLTYSFSNLFNGNMFNELGEPLSTNFMRGAFTQAFQDYADVLPINFLEVPDNNGPLPETGDYNPSGLADIRIGQVAHINGANAYAYFPTDVLYADFGDNPVDGLAGDIVFNAQRFGFYWSEILFYAVAQHEIGHSLGMGHFLDDEPAIADQLHESGYGGPVFPLTPDMVSALQGVYGAGIGSVTPVPLPPAFVLMFVAMIMLNIKLKFYRKINY